MHTYLPSIHTFFARLLYFCTRNNTHARMRPLFLPLTILAILLSSCRFEADNETDGKHYETVTVGLSDITFRQRFTASIEGRQSVKIIPRVEGYLCDIRVREGQQVRKDDTLFVIDQSFLLAEVRTAEANVSMAEANEKNARLTYESRALLHAQNIVSDFELNSAEASLAMAGAQHLQAKAQLETARANLAYTVLRSPSDGVVGSLPYRIGDFVGPGMQDGLTTIADDSEMYVYFPLTERDIMSRLQQYGSLQEVVEAFPDVTLQLVDGSTYGRKGRIASISGVVEHQTGSVSARAVFPNNGQLLSGSTGQLIVPHVMKGVQVIPQTATYEIQDKVFVYRVVDGRASAVMIEVMPISDGTNYVVKNGLQVGDVIIAKGAGFVQEGERVL